MPFFISEQTNKRYYFRVTIGKVVDNETIHLDENRKQIMCPDSGLPLVLESSKIKEMLDSNTAPGYNEFAGMSNERKKEMLTKRSNEDFRKNIAPRKEQMLKDVYHGK